MLLHLLCVLKIYHHRLLPHKEGKKSYDKFLRDGNRFEGCNNHGLGKNNITKLQLYNYQQDFLGSLFLCQPRNEFQNIDFDVQSNVLLCYDETQ